jgi:hypothetical protein
MTPELMPCPFCGGSPVIEVDHGLWEARCTMTGSPDCGVWPAMYGETRDRAVTGWNRRSSTPTRAATDAEIGEHHWRDGLRFKRLENGTVRIRHDANVIATIPAAEWESIVREVEPANRANGTALDGRLIASEVADSSSPSSTTATPDPSSRALSETEQKAVDVWRGPSAESPGSSVATLLRIIDRLTGAPK